MKLNFWPLFKLPWTTNHTEKGDTSTRSIDGDFIYKFLEGAIPQGLDAFWLCYGYSSNKKKSPGAVTRVGEDLICHVRLNHSDVAISRLLSVKKDLNYVFEHLNAFHRRDAAVALREVVAAVSLKSVEYLIDETSESGNLVISIALRGDMKSGSEKSAVFARSKPLYLIDVKHLSQGQIKDLLESALVDFKHKIYRTAEIF